MRTECLSTMSDRELVERLQGLLREERRLTAAVLLHLAEVEERELHLRAACSSMYAYCTKVLGMSEDQAFKRIRAARVARRFPAVAQAVAEGRLHLIGVLLLAPQLTDENAEELVAEASGKSKAEIDLLLARRAPRPDLPARLEPVAGQPELQAPEPPKPGPVTGGTTTARPLSPERFALQLTIGAATHEKLLRAQALLRHQVPSGDLAEVLDRVLDAGLERLEGSKFGKTRAVRAARPSRGKRYVPRAVRREVVARDGARCSFVAEDGRRCEETGFLELDHVVPVARGGAASVEGVRVLCRAHNQYEAKRILGAETVEAGRAAAAMEADLVAGLRGLGVTASDARQAVAATRSAGSGTGTIEERMRAALLALHSIYARRQVGTRCAEPTARYRHAASTLASRLGAWRDHDQVKADVAAKSRKVPVEGHEHRAGMAR